MLAIYAEMYNQIIIAIMQKFVFLYRQNWGENVLVEYLANSGSEIRLAHKCHCTCMASPLILYGIFDFEKINCVNIQVSGVFYACLGKI